MTTLLVNPPDRQSHTVSPPIGLWSLSANIPDQVTIWDEALDGSLWDSYILRNWTGHYNQLGVSIRFSSQHDDMTMWPYSGKALSDKIYLGGVHAAYADDFTWIRDQAPDDICKTGWGESWLREKMGFSPFPRFDDLQHPFPPPSTLMRYWLARKPHDSVKTDRWIPIEFSRGCGMHCAYCAVTPYWGKPQRHSLEWISDYLTYLKKEHRIEEVLIEDDSFDLSQEWTLQVIELLNKHDIWWSTPNGIPVKPLLRLDAEQRRAVSRRCWRVSLPFETGSLATAGLMNTLHKYIPWEEAQALCIDLAELGIQTTGFFIIGYPGENDHNIRITLAYANSLPLTDRYIYCATPYPGTPLYKEAKKNDYLSMKGPALFSNLSYRRSMLNTPYLDADRVTFWRELDRNLSEARKALK